MDRQDIKRAGLKITLPRMKILEIMEDSQDPHLSAEDVYKRLLEEGEDIGLATVYRVLTQFEGAGLVQRHHFESGHAVFELERGHHHDHVVCAQCNKLFEFTDEVIEERQRAVARDLGFTLGDHSLILYGNCIKENCPNKE